MGGPYHIETSQLICYENQWTGFYMAGTYIMKELINDTYQRLKFILSVPKIGRNE